MRSISTRRARDGYDGRLSREFRQRGFDRAVFKAHAQVRPESGAHKGKNPLRSQLHQQLVEPRTSGSPSERSTLSVSTLASPASEPPLAVLSQHLRRESKGPAKFGLAALPWPAHFPGAAPAPLLRCRFAPLPPGPGGPNGPRNDAPPLTASARSSAEDQFWRTRRKPGIPRKSCTMPPAGCCP